MLLLFTFLHVFLEVIYHTRGRVFLNTEKSFLNLLRGVWKSDETLGFDIASQIINNSCRNLKQKCTKFFKLPSR